MKLNKKINKLGLVPIDDPIIKKKYSFPQSVKRKYDYIKDTEPLMLYSYDYLKNNSYNEIRKGYEAITGERHMKLLDVIAFKLFMAMHR